jgi:cytochrome c peroxidase
MRDFTTLTHEVMNGRMSGPELQSGHIDALADWIDTVPAWKSGATSNQAAVERGRQLFNDAKLACASCHVGAKLTNNTTVDVGTGNAFQVPSLVGLAYRAPYMHTGCAGTLEERFGACGGARHGNTSALAPAQIGDLVAYLKTL